jgi:DNA repair exonuclease SbcCD nuclease subunit
MTLTIICVGDPHIKIDNIPEVDLFIERLEELVRKTKPDFTCILGDILHTHERLHTTPLNKAYELIKKLRDITETYVLVGNHDMISNRSYLNENHWLNGMKEWSNVTIVDRVMSIEKDGHNFFFVPYVPPGRFQEALATHEDDFLNADIIFAHQEFSGCKMGAIISIEGDKWPLNYPSVISGHIHSNQTPQENIYYPGSAMQHAFGESEKNIIPIITTNSDDPRRYTLEEVDLQLPRKKIVYMGIEDIEEYTPPTENEDKIKVTVSGVYEEFKALKKTKKYRDLTDKGVKVVFKPKKIVNNEEPLDESLSNFDDILLWKINTTKNPYLVQAYELVINNKEITADEVLFV